jgi:pimeloyl-ACP methyl ester carboxylesterase
MAERRDHTEFLGEIKVPTILIFGEADSVTDVNTARQINKQIPFSNLSIIKNAGHYSNLEQPELFNSALIKFLKTIEI